MNPHKGSGHLNRIQNVYRFQIPALRFFYDDYASWLIPVRSMPLLDILPRVLEQQRLIRHYRSHRSQRRSRRLGWDTWIR